MHDFGVLLLPRVAFYFSVEMHFCIPNSTNDQIYFWVFLLTDTLENWIAHIDGTLPVWRPAINSDSKYPICISIKIERDKNTTTNPAPPPAPNLLFFSCCPYRPFLSIAEISLSAYTTLIDIFRGPSNLIFINSTGKM